MTPEKRLWQTVVLQALRDATARDPVGMENRRAKRDAIDWIKTGGADFRRVCALAGLDHDFIRDAFLAGRIDGDALRSSEAEAARKASKARMEVARRALALRAKGWSWAEIGDELNIGATTARDYAGLARRMEAVNGALA